MLGRLLVIALAVCLYAAADDTPVGMIALYSPPNSLSANCPAGWTVASDNQQNPIQGRLLLSLSAPDTASFGATVNAPFTKDTIPVHTHTVSTTFQPKTKSTSGAACCWKDGVDSAAITVKTTSTPSSWNLPFIQMPVCVKNSSSSAANSGASRQPSKTVPGLKR